MNIGVYVYGLAEELDWAGPWEVFSARALRVLADHTGDGADGDSRGASADWTRLRPIGALHEGGALVTSVCTGCVRPGGGRPARGHSGDDLVARLHSVDRARDVRRSIQYDPEPPV